jgi:protoporphyrinogen/coproporphyrinogen III oxidase
MGMRVVIVGAGVTGLVTAFELARIGTGIECIVVEAAPRTGGNIVTLRIDDCLLDAGPDGVPTLRRDGMDLCRDLGLLERLEPPGEHAARVLIARKGRVVELPEGLVHGIPRGLFAVARTPLLTLRGRARALLDLVLPGRTSSEVSVGGLARSRLGREVTDYLVEPLVGGILAGDIDTLDAAVATPFWASAKRSLIGASARAPAQIGPAFLSPREGMCEIVDALVARIGAERIVTGAPVQAIRRLEGSWHVDTIGGGTAIADAVVIATPARAAARLLQATDSALSSRLSELRTESIASVFLCFDDPRSFPAAGSLFIPRVERRATFAASFLTTRWPWRSPNTTAIVRAYVGGARAPELLARASDTRLVGLVLSDLARYFDLPEPRWSHVVRFEASVPIPKVGHTERVRQILARAALFPGLFFAGGAYGTGVGLSSCIAEGRRAARAVLEQGRDQA